MQKVISGFLMAVCFAAGVCMLVAGMVSLVGRGGGYEKTVGYFLKSDVYSTDSDGNTTYSLTYEYYVSNEIYTVKTDVGVSSVPGKWAETTVMYNPENPSDAYIPTKNSADVLIFAGILFSVVPAVMFSVMRLSTDGKTTNKTDIIVGAALEIIGIPTIFFTLDGGVWVLVPILLVLAGAYLLAKGFFGKTEE